MPEGDTVYKVARYLDHCLSGEEIHDSYVKRQPHVNLDGRTIVRVRAHGKHLFIDLSDESSLRSHLGLYGSWHRYEDGEPWQKPRWQASIELRVGDRVFVCFSAREVEWLRRTGFRATTLTNRLGPDLTDAEVSLEMIERRVPEFRDPDDLVGDVLLDQRPAAGLGNVYKSELLFLGRVSPEARLRDLAPERLRGLYAIGRDLLGKNLDGGPRVTRFVNDGEGIKWVYGRRGLPCFECGTEIAYAITGEGFRSTYWCPNCQRP